MSNHQQQKKKPEPFFSPYIEAGEKQAVNRVIKRENPKNKAMAMVTSQLYRGGSGPSWDMVATGVMCFVREPAQKRFTLRFVNVDTGEEPFALSLYEELKLERMRAAPTVLQFYDATVSVCLFVFVCLFVCLFVGGCVVLCGTHGRSGRLTCSHLIVFSSFWFQGCPVLLNCVSDQEAKELRRRVQKKLSMCTLCMRTDAMSCLSPHPFSCHNGPPQNASWPFALFLWSHPHLSLCFLQWHTIRYRPCNPLLKPLTGKKSRCHTCVFVCVYVCVCVCVGVRGVIFTWQVACSSLFLRWFWH